jgi:hypothetical protein
MINKTFFIL